MTEPIWLTQQVVLAIQKDLLHEHGGSPGLRDGGLLESALGRPRHRWAYAPDCDLADLAAAYGFGVARNHPFIDGNKRIAFQAMYVFLGLNGLRITASEPDVVGTMVDIAAGALDEEALATWLRSHAVPR